MLKFLSSVALLATAVVADEAPPTTKELGMTGGAIPGPSGQIVQDFSDAQLRAMEFRTKPEFKSAAAEAKPAYPAEAMPAQYIAEDCKMTVPTMSGSDTAKDKEEVLVQLNKVDLNGPVPVWDDTGAGRWQLLNTKEKDAMFKTYPDLPKDTEFVKHYGNVHVMIMNIGVSETVGVDPKTKLINVMHITKEKAPAKANGDGGDDSDDSDDEEPASQCLCFKCGGGKKEKTPEEIEAKKKKMEAEKAKKEAEEKRAQYHKTFCTVVIIIAIVVVLGCMVCCCCGRKSESADEGLETDDDSE